MIRKTASILIKSGIIVVGILGIVLTVISSGFMGGRYVFMYFTVQSNITEIIIAAVFLANELSSRKFAGQTLLRLKFVFTIAITITFLVFFTMLVPFVSTEYLTSFNNLSLHAIVPLLAIADFFIFDTDISLSYPGSMAGLAMPLYYVLFYFIGVPLGFQYSEAGNTAPYFFLNFREIGWFMEKGTVGVILWIIILVVLMSCLCMLFAFFMKRRQKTGIEGTPGNNNRITQFKKT